MILLLFKKRSLYLTKFDTAIFTDKICLEFDSNKEKIGEISKARLAIS